MHIFRTLAFTFFIGAVACEVGRIVNDPAGIHIVFFGYNIFPELVIAGLSCLTFRGFFRFNAYDAIGVGVGAGFVFGGVDNSAIQSSAALVSVLLGGFLINYLLLTRLSV